MAILRTICWALLFILKLRFSPGQSLVDIMPYQFSHQIFFQDPKQKVDELSRGKLLRKDVQGIILSITPHFPYISLSAGVTGGKHVSKHMYNRVSELDVKE